MSVTKTNLEKLNKKEVVELTLKLQEKYDEKIEMLLTQIKSLTDKVHNLADTITNLTKKNEVLESDSSIKSTVNSTLHKRLINIEKDLYQQQQYSRMECIEIVGIPLDVKDKDLEDMAVSLFHNINVEDIYHSDIQACHRLKDKKRVIVKLTNRKDVFKVFNSKKLLKDQEFEGFSKKVFINESLCPYYRMLFGKCYRLVGAKKAERVFTRNGLVKLKVEVNGEAKVFDVLHDSFFDEHFADFDFSKR